MLKVLVFLAIVSLIRSVPAPQDPNPMHAGLFEGDIAGIDPLKGIGHIPDSTHTKWPSGDGAKARVPFVINTNQFSQSEINTIKKGMTAIEESTRTSNGDCIKFVDKTEDDKTWINVIRDSGCWSWVGMQREPGTQDLSIGNGCAYDMIVAHEFMHALGIWHEQSRPDRDDYVELDLSVVPSGQWHNFNKYTTGITLCNTNYDIYSIMHYENTAFSTVSGRYSIWAKDGTPLLPTWQKSDLTKIDVSCLREYYACN